MKPVIWTKTKVALLSILVVAAVGSVAWGVRYAWLISPPPMPENVEQALQTLSSPRYARLPEYRKKEYHEQAHRLMRDLEPDEMREVFERARADDELRQSLRQVRRQEMVDRAIAFAKADPAQRNQMLDESIDRMEQMRSRFAGRTGGDRGGRGERGGPGGRPGGDNDRRERFRQRIQERFEHGNPQVNSLIGEYFRAMRQRRQERGMTTR